MWRVSAGQLGGKQTTFPHDALPYADAGHGGVTMLEVADNRLDVKWICADGLIRDQFTMMKEVNQNAVIRVKKGDAVTLKASYVGTYHWTGDNAISRSITVSPEKSTVYEVTDGTHCLRDQFSVQVSER